MSPLRQVLGFMLLAVGCSEATAQSPLQGVNQVTVSIDLSDDAPEVVDKQRLQTITELKLRTVGMRVLSDAENRADRHENPRVVVTVSLLRSTAGSEHRPIG